MIISKIVEVVNDHNLFTETLDTELYKYTGEGYTVDVKFAVSTHPITGTRYSALLILSKSVRH